MKSIKNILITSALAAGLSGTAMANTTLVIHVVGAPAFRQPVNDAIESVVESFNASPSSAGPAGLTATTANTVPAFGSRIGSGSSIEGAKNNQWLIPNFASGVDLEINATFSGSAAGVESVASFGSTTPKTQKFIPDTFATPADVTSPQTATSATPVAASVALAPDANWIVNTDTFQASTLFTGTKTFATGAGTTTYTFQPLNKDVGNGGSPAGVEVYHWVASPNAPANFTNITTAQAKALYQAGSLPLAFFTGNNNDEGTTVYALSRDGGSGARIIALADIGVQPAGKDTAIVTVVPTISGTGAVLDNQASFVGGTVSAINEAPAATIPSTGINEPLGDTGYAAFGGATNGGSTVESSTSASNAGLLQAITATPPAGAIFVTYLDNDDTNEALAVSSGASGAYTPPTTGGSAKLLTYNGVAASLTPGVDAVVAEGEYTFWSYESFLSLPGLNTNAKTFLTSVETAFPNYAALPYGDLNVSRTVDGGAISQGY